MRGAASARNRSPRLRAEIAKGRSLCPKGAAAVRRRQRQLTEQLDCEPAPFFKRRIVRRKYARKDHPFAAPILAPLDTLQARCIAAPGLIAAVIAGKYCGHLPLYRQGQIFATRHGVQIPRQSMAQWMGLAADWLRPIYETIRTGGLGGGSVQVDESSAARQTPIEYLVPGNGETKLGYLWTCSRPGGDAVFTWHTSRAAVCLQSIIPSGFRGTLQTDGYSAYRAFVRSHNAAAGCKAITLAGCWAHARRGFIEARERAPRIVGWLLRHIARLCQIGRRLRESGAGPRLRDAVRASQSTAIVNRIRTALQRIRPRHLPQSAMGRAITYALDQWPALARFLTDGRIEIDNNGVENAIRPTAIGKKNWLFIGAAEASQRGAILYTIVESCRRRGLDPLAYLRDVLTRLPKMTTGQIPEVTPEAWAKAHRQRQDSRAAA